MENMSGDNSGASNLNPLPKPAPWTVQAWWFVTSLGHRPDAGETLPISYFPSQETHLYKHSTEKDAFRGGRGSVTLIRYTDTPIGSYDELSIAPGEFTNPFGQQSHRVTRAYVSSLEAVVNGRHNWGFPRELAEFVFTPSLEIPDACEVRVYPATAFSPIEYSSSPCFAALIKPISWLPAIPTSLSHFPRVKLCQPPLESSPEPSFDGLVRNTKWHMLDCSDAQGRAKPFRCEGLLPPLEEVPSPGLHPTPPSKRKRLADGVGFPAVDAYSVGIHWINMSMTLPQAVPLATL
ncbi:hypothetical protein C8Q70DRAFT_253278 [Cubamyces menziesii]|nr:hypothetical protein C8Q70DRAFT_253278 [Cubamyces menziesii]